MGISSRIPDLTNSTIDNGSLLLTKRIGSGGFGVVYHAIHSTTTTEYAVKCQLRHEAGTRGARYQARETTFHRLVSSHPNIVTIHRVIVEDAYVFIVMDLCPSGNLLEIIAKRGIFWQNNKLVKQVFTQIIDAVQACHDKHIYHRDLKPENILCSVDASKVYLTDFGLASSRSESDHRAGTAPYESPECRNAKSTGRSFNTSASDVWSLGLVLLNMLTGRSPWAVAEPSDINFTAYLDDPHFFAHTLPLSREMDGLIRRVLSANPCCRPSLAEVREEIRKMKTFFLTDKQIAKSNGVVQAVAHCYSKQKRMGLYREPFTPNAPPVPSNVAIRCPSDDFDIDDPAMPNHHPTTIYAVEKLSSRSRTLLRRVVRKIRSLSL